MSSSDKLLARYRELAVRRGKYQLIDSRKANRAFDQLKDVVAALHQAGPEHFARILTLLDDDDINVRLSAAYEALSIEPEKGLRVFREIAAGPKSVHRMDAEQTLDMWHAGTLPLQWWAIE